MAALRRHAVLGILLFATAAAMAFTSPLGADYPGPSCSVCDFAGPPIAALSHGDVSRFFAVQPVMGSLSLILRAPFAAIARVGDSSELLQYRLGAFACLIGVAAFALGLERLMARDGRSLVVRVAAMALIVANPLVFAALRWGHPEEALAAALCVGGVVLAMRGRSIAAGVALGLALATKDWAWLAVLPAMIVVPARLRFLAVAAVTAAVFVVPMAIGDPARFIAQIHHYSIPGNGLTPANVWWVYGHEGGIDLSGGGFRGAPTYVLPGWLGHSSHLLVIGVALMLTLACWRRAAREPSDVLALVALILLARSMLDPLTYSYHHLPFFTALVAHEALRSRRLPLVSMFAAGIIWVMTRYIAPLDDPTLLNRVYLAWSVPVAGYLAVTLFVPKGIRPRTDRRASLKRALRVSTA